VLTGFAVDTNIAYIFFARWPVFTEKVLIKPFNYMDYAYNERISGIHESFNHKDYSTFITYR
jgi:hypothetical protein